MRATGLILMNIVIALSLSACGEEYPEVNYSGGGGLGNAVFVSISADPAEFVPGQRVVITVAISNPTRSWLNCGESSDLCYHDAFVSYNGRRRSIGWDRNCSGSGYPWGVGPGQRLEESWVWRGDVLVDGNVHQLPAGTYTIRGAIRYSTIEYERTNSTVVVLDEAASKTE